MVRKKKERIVAVLRPGLKKGKSRKMDFISGKKNVRIFNPDNPNHAKGVGKFHHNPFAPKLVEEPKKKAPSKRIFNFTPEKPITVQGSREDNMGGEITRRPMDIVSRVVPVESRANSSQEIKTMTSLVGHSGGSLYTPSPLVSSRDHVYIPPSPENHSANTLSLTANVPVQSLTRTAEPMLVDTPYVAPPRLNWPAAKERSLDFTFRSPKPPPKQPELSLHHNFNWPAKKQPTVDFTAKPLATEYVGEHKRRRLDPHREDKPWAPNKPKPRVPPPPKNRPHENKENIAPRITAAKPNKGKAPAVPKKPSQSILNRAKIMRDLATNPGTSAEGKKATTRLNTYMKKHGLSNKDF